MLIFSKNKINKKDNSMLNANHISFNIHFQPAMEEDFGYKANYQIDGAWNVKNEGIPKNSS